MFFSDQNISFFALFLALKDKLIFNYEEPKPVNSQITSGELREAMINARKLDTYFLAKEINNEICVEVSDKVVNEIKMYKWIESEKAGRNLWEDEPSEHLQFIAAGKQWAKEHWTSFKAAHGCECLG